MSDEIEAVVFAYHPAVSIIVRLAVVESGRSESLFERRRLDQFLRVESLIPFIHILKRGHYALRSEDINVRAERKAVERISRNRIRQSPVVDDGLRFIPDDRVAHPQG